MSETPAVGPPTDEHRAVCVYSPTADAPQCDLPAALHIAVIDDAYGLVSLASCQWHALIARASGEPYGEHPYGIWCGFPSTTWEADGCALAVADV